MAKEMTHQQILELALTKAMENGYDGKLPIAGDSPTHKWHPYGLIFNHKFAKALWPDDGKRPETPDGVVMDWQYHLQQMVIADDPFKYLGDNI